MRLAMHNYTLQCFGTIAALTNEKGAHVAEFPLPTGSYIGLLAVPNCLKSLKLEGMTIGLKWTDDGLFMALSRGDFWCNLIAHGAIECRDGSTIVYDLDDWSAMAESGRVEPEKPAPGAELLKLVPASHKRHALYKSDVQAVDGGGLVITKKSNPNPVIKHAIESVEYWGGVEPLRGLVKPFTRGHDALRIDFDGIPMMFTYPNAKLIEKLSKKATFGAGRQGSDFCLLAYLDGYTYIFLQVQKAYRKDPYITLTLNTVMEQVA